MVKEVDWWIEFIIWFKHENVIDPAWGELPTKKWDIWFKECFWPKSGYSKDSI